MTVTWTDEMIEKLKSLRLVNAPLYICAEEVGVGYATAVHKARDLDIAQRRNHGRMPGHTVSAIASGASG